MNDVMRQFQIIIISGQIRKDDGNLGQVSIAADRQRYPPLVRQLSPDIRVER